MSQCSVVPSCYASVDDRCVIFGSGGGPSVAATWAAPVLLLPSPSLL
jgi:hypothetical protein